MSETTSVLATTRYAAREVVGVFPTAEALEAAIEQLGIVGVDRAAISVLGVDAQRSGHVDAIYRSAKAISDDPLARQAAFISHASQVEGGAAAIAFPLTIGGFAAAWVVAAAGGALVIAIGATVVGGALGAGLGALLYHAVARQHAAKIQAQLASGGLILWVSTPDQAAEDRALAVLARCSGASVHAHMIDRQWGVADVPLHDLQPDPFLEHETLP
jgi:hypothetical protein